MLPALEKAREGGMDFGTMTESKVWKRLLEHSKNAFPLRNQTGHCFGDLAILSTGLAC